MGKRLFSLYNESGAQKALNGESGIRFTSPAGLGISLKPTLADLHEGFFRATAEDIIPQQSIAGSLTFMGKNTNGTPISGGSYGQYLDFVNWLFTAKKLYFGYTPQGTGGTEYRCEVALDYITKTERRGTWLPCTVSFKMLTPWFTEEGTALPAPTGSSGIVVPITVQGHVPAGLRIKVTGGSYPMSFTLENTDTHRIDSFTVEGPGAGYLEFSTQYKDSYIRCVNGSTVKNMIGQTTISSGDIFFRAPPGVTCALSIGYSSAPTRIELWKYQYYRSV